MSYLVGPPTSLTVFRFIRKPEAGKGAYNACKKPGVREPVGRANERAVRRPDEKADGRTEKRTSGRAGGRTGEQAGGRVRLERPIGLSNHAKDPTERIIYILFIEESSASERAPRRSWAVSSADDYVRHHGPNLWTLRFRLQSIAFSRLYDVRTDPAGQQQKIYTVPLRTVRVHYGGRRVMYRPCPSVFVVIGRLTV